MILPPTLRHHLNQWTTQKAGPCAALGQAMDAAENIELEIGEYNDRIQRAVDEANAAAGGSGKED